MNLKTENKKSNRTNTLSLSSSLSASSSSEDNYGKDDETPEEIIFMLFGPRVWEHEGKICQVVFFSSF